MKKKILALLFIGLMALTNVFAQTAENPKVINNLHKRGFRGLKSITNKTTGEIIGHYIFYRENSNLAIEFLDTELNTYAIEILPVDDQAEINEVIYNGQDLMFSVIERNGTRKATLLSYFTSMKFFTYSIEGKQLGTRSTSYSVVGDVDLSIFPCVSDGTFYIITPTGSAFTVEKVTNSFQTVWTKNMMPSQGVSSCEAAFAGNDRLVLVVRNRESWLSKKVTTELVCFSDSDGDKLFSSSLYDNDITAMPSQIIIDKDYNILASGEYFKGKKERNVKSAGIFIKKISSTGEDIVYNRQSWKDGIQKQLKKTKASLSFKNKVLFHSMVLSPGGGYQVIGETFSTSRMGSFLGMLDSDDFPFLQAIAQIQRLKVFTTAIVSGRFIGFPDPDYSPSTLTIQDLVVFNFDKELNLIDVNKIAKNYTKVYTYAPYDLYGGLKKAKILADFGFFDFAFTQKAADGENEYLVYNAAYSNKPHMGVVSIENGVPNQTKQIMFKDISGSRNSGKRGLTGCAPSVPGKMVIYYFIKNEKDENGEKKDKDSSGSVYYYLEDLN